MCDKNETNEQEESYSNINERTLTLIKDIMSDFTDVVKMLTDTMSSQLGIIKDQEKNSMESTRIHNETINRQLDIVEKQHELLMKIFDKTGVDEKEVKKMGTMWKSVYEKQG